MNSSNVTAHLYGIVGRAIARYRLEAGLSQAVLAESIGLTRTSISNIEKGRQKMLVHTLVDIAASLSIPVAALLDGTLTDDDNMLEFSGSAVSPSERAAISAIVGANSKQSNQP